MIFKKRRSYSIVLFIPREYFGLKNFKLNANKSNYPAKNYFIVMIFQNRRSYQLFYLSPRVFFLFNALPVLARTPAQRFLLEGSSTFRRV